MIRRRMLVAVVSVVSAVGLLLGGAASGLIAPSVDAATPDLTMVATARYDVQPDKHRVHVTVSLNATSHTVDTVIRRYYVDHAFLAVLPGTSAFKAAGVGAKTKPTVQISSRGKAQTLLRLNFGSKLGSGKTLGLTLTFDLVDPGGAATRQVRIGDTLATFPVWAFGSAGVSGGSVMVSFPADYQVEVEGGPLTGPKTGTGGTSVYTSGSLSKPLSFVAYIVADRPGAYLETPLSLTVAGAPLAVVVRAWNDDAAFGKRTATLVSKALPALGSLIGIAVPGDGSTLAVEEAITRAAGGYAALYDSAGRRIVVAYDATPGAVLREAAHAWFNGALVADGWAAEGFAAYYATAAATPLKVTVTPQPMTKTILAAKIPLNAWDGSGRADVAVDAYVRAASLQLATSIATRAGPTGLAAVWKAVAAGEQADLPVAGDTSAAAATGAAGAAGAAVAPDWRVLLDLLETRTNATYTDLWQEWVVRPDEASLLTARTAARDAYSAALAEADGWALPATIRTALDAWQFPTATDLISQSRAVLGSRAALVAAAASAGLTLPSTAKVAFEGSGPAAAAAEITAERTAIDRIAADTAARPTAADPVEEIGLIGSLPEAALAAARSAFAAGDLVGAVQSADAARLTWDGARDLGRGRLAIAAAILAVFGIALLLVTHRRDRNALPAMTPIRTMPRMKELSATEGPSGGRRLPNLGRRKAPPTPATGPWTAAAASTRAAMPPTGRSAPRSAPPASPGSPTSPASPGSLASPRLPTADASLPEKSPRIVVVPGRQPRPTPPPPKGFGALIGRRAPAPPPRPQMAHRIEPLPGGLTSTPVSRSEGSPRYGTLADDPPGTGDEPTGRQPEPNPKTASSPLDPAPGDDR